MGTEESEVRIIEKIDLKTLPGASGIGLQAGAFWVIGDDSRTCNLYSKKFKLKDTVVIPSMEGALTANGRIAKNDKADLEALVVISDVEVLALGSGSRPKRETAVRILRKNGYEVEEYSLMKFYGRLRKLPEMKGAELNIEAAAILGDQLYLFNRPNGLMIALHYRDFMRHIAEGAPMPKLEIHRLNVPVFEGLRAGISGASFEASSGRLILTASLEVTNDAYNDGEILGSYVGSISVLDMIENEVLWDEIPTDGESMKIESVEVVSYSEENSSYELVMTVDNDNGRSHVLRVHYRPGY